MIRNWNWDNFLANFYQPTKYVFRLELGSRQMSFFNVNSGSFGFGLDQCWCSQRQSKHIKRSRSQPQFKITDKITRRIDLIRGKWWLELKEKSIKWCHLERLRWLRMWKERDCVICVYLWNEFRMKECL